MLCKKQGQCTVLPIATNTRPTCPPGPVLATVRSPELIVAVLDSAGVSSGCTAARLSSIPQDDENTASLFLIGADGSSK